MNLSVVNQQTSRYGLVFAANLVSRQSRKLTDSAFRLWIILHTYAPKDPVDGWTISAERLSEDAGFSRSTFFRALASLKDSKLIRVENIKSSGECNRYYLLNARNVKIDFNGQTRGVTTDTGGCQSSDTGGGSPGETHTGAFTGASTSNNPPNPPEGGIQLQGFLGRLLDELFSKLAKMDDYDQVEFLMQDNAFDYATNHKQSEWHLKSVFKGMCIDTEGDDPICYAIAERLLAIAPTESGRKRSANKRRAFLTECQEIVREYGRQL